MTTERIDPLAVMDAPAAPWQPISLLPYSDDLFWFLRGDTIDGPRRPQFGGYDADEWDYFAPAEAPPTRVALATADPIVAELVSCFGDARDLLDEIDKGVRAEHAKNGHPQSRSVAGIVSERLSAALAAFGRQG